MIRSGRKYAKVVYAAAVSLNGYLAHPAEAMDWLGRRDDVQAISTESWKGVDTVLMGRKTYEVAAGICNPQLSDRSSYAPINLKLIFILEAARGLVVPDS